MPRLLGVDIPNDKPIVISLRYLYGVGDRIARELCHKAGIETIEEVAWAILESDGKIAIIRSGGGPVQNPDSQRGTGARQ